MRHIRSSQEKLKPQQMQMWLLEELVPKPDLKGHINSFKLSTEIDSSCYIRVTCSYNWLGQRPLVCSSWIQLNASEKQSRI